LNFKKSQDFFFLASSINFGAGNGGVGAGVANTGWLTLKTFPVELMIFMATKWIQLINIFCIV